MGKKTYFINYLLSIKNNLRNFNFCKITLPLVNNDLQLFCSFCINNLFFIQKMSNDIVIDYYFFYFGNSYPFLKSINKVIESLRNVFFHFNNISNKMYYRFISFAKFYIVGLGNKCFIYKKTLYILWGLTHYILIPLKSNSIKIICRKRRFYFLGPLLEVKRLRYLIQQIRKINVYKPRGLFFKRQFKGIIKIKPGKKKQYM